MNGTHGLITQVESEKALSKESEKCNTDVGAHLAPVALWRKIEIKSSNIRIGEVLGQGAYSTVYRCLFKKKHAALTKAVPQRLQSKHLDAEVCAAMVQ